MASVGRGAMGDGDAKLGANAPDVVRTGRARVSVWLLAGAICVSASAVAGWHLAGREQTPAVVASRAWHGKVSTIARSGADRTSEGLFSVTAAGKIPLAEGAEVKAGMRLATDGRTRARFAFDDGSSVVLDRASEITIAAGPRSIRLESGSALAEVAHVEGAPVAHFGTEAADVRVLGTKLALTAAADRTHVEVLRGEVEVASVADASAGKNAKRVSAGQEGVVGKDGHVDVAPANDLAQRAAFGEQLLGLHNEDAEAPASGLGELRAKRPGKTDEKDHAVRLAKHTVTIRIAGAVARTEIDEEFANDTGDDLEGIYRFPLPPGAQIERLALETDGKLLDGEFVDKAKASAIWRGAIQNAIPLAPKPKEEIVWVPGPWRDPALLEWQRGGRFELRIFPIPKHGSRRVVIAYTEPVAPVSGIRRYVYPLPQGSSSKLTIDRFSVDAQVVGHDPKKPVAVRGYELDRGEAASARFAKTMNAFTPSGDLAIEYAADEPDGATAWGFSAPAETKAVEPSPKDPPTTDADGAFVAIALRPKLPRWTETKPRDHVIVVDAGRTMYGERFARAKRLAVQMVQEMDRRDRVTVLACDVVCKALPGGFVPPGAPSAHDIDAFLAGVTPDGASDLVSAVRAAAKVGGRDATRDLRVALLSDGVATAGYRSPSRVAIETTDALGDPRALVAAVPIGADADVAFLSEIARGGGGVVVSYQPGQRLEATAIDVLNATYGTTLRDVEVVLPDGLFDAAPARIPPIRAGAETIVAARMRGGRAVGDVVLRGKVGGDPFEARYPIDVRATTDAGNAFVPRLFATARIADRERETGESARAELVALSRRFAVPSRFTSLLVLESEAMFKAFGIDRAAHGPQWTGESVALTTTVAGKGEGAAARAGDDDADERLGAFGSLAVDKSKAEAKKDLAGEGLGGGGRADLAAPPRPAAAPQAEPPPPPRKAAAADPFAETEEARSPSRRRPGNGGRFMKKIFVRHASLGASAGSPVATDKIAQARDAVAAAPDERAKHKELAKLLALSGQLEELGETLEKWSQRDPLDVDVIVARADLAARRGDRDTSLRILGGALSAPSLSAQDAFTIAQTVGRSFERFAKPESCAFHVAAAELRPTDVDAVARAVACERASGHDAAAERWLGGAKEPMRASVVGAIAKTGKPEAIFGDVVVAANWTGGADVDLAIVDPAGRRAAAATRMKNVRVEGASSREHETLALSSGEAGAFLVEVVRADADTRPVSGTVKMTALGQTHVVPFTLTGTRAVVGRVDLRWDAELVPIDQPSPNVPVTTGRFDPVAAAGALSRISLDTCSASGQVGTGHATVVFSPFGGVANVTIDDANFANTPAGNCVRRQFFLATVPPFTGPTTASVAKSFTVGFRR